jgi:hypothetical protein
MKNDTYISSLKIVDEALIILNPSNSASYRGLSPI